MDPDHKYQIEGRLRRELSSGELLEVGSFDGLRKTQLDLVAILARRSGVAAVLYVQAVVPSASPTDVRNFVLNIEQFIAGKFPPGPKDYPLRMEDLYEKELGRALTEEEKRPGRSLQELSAAHLAVARELSLKDPVHGMIYLGDIVPSASSYDRETFAENLRRNG